MPIFTWLPNYKSEYFKNDLFAGLTLFAYAIPVSLAYSSLAGLPPQYGIYGYLIGGLFFALFTSTKQIAVGPTSAISILVGTAIASLAAGDAHKWADLASTTALMFALMSIAAYFLKLSSMINFISETVLLGFKAGAALTIGLTQLPKIFGFGGSGHNFLERAVSFFQNLPQTNLYVLAFGIVVFVVFVLAEKYMPGKPIAIWVVILSIILMAVTSLSNVGFVLVGEVPNGLPGIYIPIPRFSVIEEDAALAFACFLLAYIETVSAAKALSEKNGDEFDARQELLSLGMANLAITFGHGYPVSGGLSQSAVNDSAGAKTPLSLIITSVAIVCCLLFFASLLKTLPVVVLACVVIIAIKGLVDFKEFKRLYKVNKVEFIIALSALLSVLMFGILQGIIIGAVASLIFVIKEVSSPRIAVLGKIPGTNKFSDMDRHPDNEKVKDLAIFRVESPLLYFNVNNVYQKINERIKTDYLDVKYVVLDLSSSPYIDAAGAKIIKKLYLDLEQKGICLKLTEARSDVRDMLRLENVEHLFGHIGRRSTLLETVQTISSIDISDKGI